MENKNKDKDWKTLTLEDIVCKWYSGAAIGAGIGNLCGNTLVGIVVGSAVGFAFHRFIDSKNGKK
ncbi:MAG: glycine zipper domain-containing protein [Hespellia sp.]|nr:glycine zipper domain-containing protein [Hespellia sp.]